MKIFFSLLISLITCNQVFSQKPNISCYYCEKPIKYKQRFYTIAAEGARRYQEKGTLARAHEYDQYDPKSDKSQYYILEWRRGENKYCSKKCATEADNN